MFERSVKSERKDVSKPFVTLWQPVACLLNPVSNSIGWNGILPTQLVRRNVFLQNFSHDRGLGGLGNGVVIDDRFSDREKCQYRSELEADWPNSVTTRYKDDVTISSIHSIAEECW